MQLQKVLEGDQYVTTSLLVPLIDDIRTTLQTKIDNYPGAGASELHTRIFNVMVRAENSKF
jgi:hypothetical protein